MLWTPRKVPQFVFRASIIHPTCSLLACSTPALLHQPATDCTWSRHHTMQQLLLQRPPAFARGCLCAASSSHGHQPNSNSNLRRAVPRQQHGAMTSSRHSTSGRRLQPSSRRAPHLKHRAVQRGGAGSSSNSSSKGTPSKRAPSGQQADSTSPYYWWLQRLPGDSGWDLFKMRERDAKTFNRIREAEVIHARWAMLGVISLLLSDVSGSPFPPKEASLATLAPWGVVVLLSLAFIETYRLAALWGEEDFEKRAYPGKRFDVLGLTRPKTPAAAAPGEPEQLPGFGVFAPWLGGLAGWLAGGWWFERREMTQVELMEMKSRELRNGRLAMVSFVGCFLASALTGKGPITLLLEHLADPVHSTVVQTLQ